jgi:hypothetical protein
VMMTFQVPRTAIGFAAPFWNQLCALADSVRAYESTRYVYQKRHNGTRPRLANS